jgi:hypothetical protein
MVDSFSDEAAEAIERLIDKQGDSSFIELELPGYDTFVVEAHDGGHAPFTASDAVSQTAIFSFTSKMNGDLVSDPEVVVAKVNGSWFPFNWKSDRPPGVKDVRLASVEQGAVVLVEGGSHPTPQSADTADSAKEQYSQTLEYCEDWFPSMAARYSDVEPA